MVLSKILIKNAHEFASNPALTMQLGYRSVALNFLQVYQLSCKVAAFLESQGVKQGDRVVLCAPNSPYWVCVFWGCVLQGVVVVPMMMQSTSNMFEKVIAQTEAKLLFISRYSTNLPKSVVPRFYVEYLSELVKDFDGSSLSASNIEPCDLVEILYTSGTTGEPKGVMLTHENLMENVEAISRLFNFSRRGECILSVLPLSHIFEQTMGFLLPFSLGIHIVYTHSNVAIPSLLKRYKVTKMLVVPEFLKVMMGRLLENHLSKTLFSSLDKVTRRIKNKKIKRFLFWPWRRELSNRLEMIACGGSALDVNLERQWRAMGINLLQGYGLTETSPVVTCNNYHEHKEGSVGKPVKGVDIKLADDGEILIKGRSVFVGYYNDEERTQDAFTPDGWFKAGDIGFFDDEGFLFIKGRKKYLIKGSGAQNVYPEDIEAELNKLVGVQDSCVLGMEMLGGNVQIHAVLLGKDLDEKLAEDIIKIANESLASYQQITAWTLWPQDDFPRSATRKIKKEDVRKFLLSIKADDKKSSGGKQATKLQQILSQLSGVEVEKITGFKKIAELNMDSLLRVELILQLGQEFNVELGEDVFNATLTVGQLEELVSKKNVIKKKVVHLKHWPRMWLFRVLGRGLRFVLNCFARALVRVKVVGLENIKSVEGPVVFMPNHQSYLDSIFLNIALPSKFSNKISYAAAQDFLYGEFWYFAWLGELFFNSFPFPRNEGENINDGLVRMGKMLDLGFSVVVFPEGQVSQTGEILLLKQGAGLIATEMHVDIIPVKFEGIQHIVPYDKFFPRRFGKITVKFGRPVKLDAVYSYSEATAKIEQAIKAL